ncbi:MAG: F0F1 ATP synthase subunit beta, partial [Muribaculaceae bacterium]|nr:F0F1 ATP synthase subunit beta [Muribaculaceae bacterium]
MSDNKGKIAQVIGPVVDVIFEGEGNVIPPIYTALKIDRPEGGETILEVEQHIGENTVRCVAMESTDGLRRGLEVVNLERPIAVPTGDQIKGRLLNVLGDAIDKLPELSRENLRPIH